MADISDILRRAHALAQGREYTQAMAMIARLLPRHADNPNVCAMQCSVMAAQGRYVEALTFARRAVKAAPSDVNMLSNLAGILLTYIPLLALAILSMALSMARTGLPVSIPQVSVFALLFLTSTGFVAWYMAGCRPLPRPDGAGNPDQQQVSLA